MARGKRDAAPVAPVPESGFTEQMQHGRHVRRNFALPFVLPPPERIAAVSMGFTGQRYEKNGGDGDE